MPLIFRRESALVGLSRRSPRLVQWRSPSNAVVYARSQEILGDGQVHSQTDARNNRTEFGYDAAGRISFKRELSNIAISMTGGKELEDAVRSLYKKYVREEKLSTHTGGRIVSKRTLHNVNTRHIRNGNFLYIPMKLRR